METAWEIFACLIGQVVPSFMVIAYAVYKMAGWRNQTGRVPSLSAGSPPPA